MRTVSLPQCHPSDLGPGDLVAYGPVSWRWSPLGWAIGHTISAATYPWEFGPNALRICHMAIVAPYRDHLAIWESTIDEGLGPCLDALRDDVKGVQIHPLKDRLRLHLDGRMGRAWRLPLLSTAWRDSASASLCMGILETICTDHLRVPYDLLGAAQARSFGFGWTRRFRRARSDANRAFFCSEFTAHVYQAMGWLGDDVIPSHENPKSLASLVVSRGICGPPEEIEL